MAASKNSDESENRVASSSNSGNGGGVDFGGINDPLGRGSHSRLLCADELVEGAAACVGRDVLPVAGIILCYESRSTCH